MEADIMAGRIITDLGARWLISGQCQFRVWAPKVKCVAVCIDGSSPRSVPLEPEANGYHAAIIPDVWSGTRYQFDLGNGLVRPDPASMWQPDGVHRGSAVVDPRFDWSDPGWSGHDLADYVIYELHIGTFTKAGTFDAAIGELHRLRELGITAIEVMPVAQFPGERNWGYDGVSPFAVQNSYGGPVGMKRFVDACHGQGIAVILDVVYNHLGPEGNYLRDFGPYFTDRYKTPWGEALNFDGPGSDGVRTYFLANARMWLHEFRIDALRLDAVHAIKDASAIPFLMELGEMAQTLARQLGRKLHLIAESDANDSRIIRPTSVGGTGLDAVWSDDLHHAIHTLLTGERESYYADYGKLDHLAHSLRDGFAYTGQHSPHRGRKHGNSTAGCHPWQFIVCAQNHDQIGNRARGDRLSTLVDFESLKLAAGLTLLSPYVPLLFMGEEYGETAHFQYFVSHGDRGLIEAVRKGRREEFKAFAWQGEVPNPDDEAVFQRSKLNAAQATEGKGRILHDFYHKLLTLRKTMGSLGSRAEHPPEVAAYEKHETVTLRRTANEIDSFIIYHLGTSVTEARIALPIGRWRKLVDSAATHWNGPGTSFPDDYQSDGEAAWQLPPRSFVVYEQVR